MQAALDAESQLRQEREVQLAKRLGELEYRTEGKFEAEKVKRRQTPAECLVSSLPRSPCFGVFKKSQDFSRQRARGFICCRSPRFSVYDEVRRLLEAPHLVNPGGFVRVLWRPLPVPYLLVTARSRRFYSFAGQQLYTSPPHICILVAFFVSARKALRE